MKRSPTAAVALVSLMLAACGGSPTTEPAAQPAAETPAESTVADSTGDEPVTEPEQEPADESSAEPAPEPETTMQSAPTVLEQVSAPDDTEPAEGSEFEEPAPEPVEEPAPEPEYIWPDDGCSADNSPTPAAAADGPAPVVEVRPDAANSPNPLPDLAVRRINCKGGWENLRNELPAALPLLVWVWAPH